MGKRVSKKGKGSYATYAAESRQAKNRIVRLERHLKKFPEDAAALVAIKTLKTPRKPSRTKGNFPEAKVYVSDEAGHKTDMPSFTPPIFSTKKGS